MGDESSKRIEETCTAIRAAGIPLVVQNKLEDSGRSLNNSIVKKPTDSDFHTACRTLFQVVVKGYQDIGIKNAGIFWSPDLIKTVQEYRTKHNFNFEAQLIGPYFGNIGINYSNKRLLLGAFLDPQLDRNDIISSLDHERGHVRDFEAIMKIRPESLQNERKLINTMLDLIKEFAPVGPGIDFRKAAERIFGNVDQMGPDELSRTLNIVSDIIRAGEETQDPRLRYSRRTPSLLRNLDPNESQIIVHNPPASGKPLSLIYFIRVFIVAYHQELGTWPQIQLRNDFDPAKTADLDPKHIAFFRLCIQAAVKLQKSFAASQKNR